MAHTASDASIHPRRTWRPITRLRELLDLLINQSMHDGIYRIRLGVGSAVREQHLRYFGTLFYEEE